MRVSLFYWILILAFGAEYSYSSELKWKYPIGEYNYSFNQSKLAAAGDLIFEMEMSRISSSPAIGYDGTIYIGSFDTHLYALNPDGTLKWQYKTDQPVSSAPAIDIHNTIYFGSGDGNLYALHPDGTLKWRGQTGDEIISSPAISGDTTIYVASMDNYLYAADPDGSLKWKYRTGGQITSSPSINYDGTVYVGSADSYLYALNIDGSLKWRYKTGDWIYSSPAIGSDNTIYISSMDSYLYAVNPDGTLKWRYKTGEMIWSSPVIGGNGTIYIGSWDDYLYALTPEGTLLWRYNTGGDIVFTPAVGSDETIYVGSVDHLEFTNTYLNALSPEGILKWRFKIEEVIDCSPTLDRDGTIYIGAATGFLNPDLPAKAFLYAIDSGTGSGLSDSPWPKFCRDLQNTARVGPGEKTCDYNGDGKISIADVIKLLLLQREQDPRGDYNRDGELLINDAISLLNDIINGNCPDADVLLSSSGCAGIVAGIDGLGREEIDFIERAMAQMDLSADIEAAFHLALYGGKAAADLPQTFALSQNYPNPFNPSTTVSYAIPEGSKVKARIELFNLQGRLVKVLADVLREPGNYQAQWDGRDSQGKQVSSGVYFYRMSAGEFMQVRKMVLLK